MDRWAGLQSQGVRSLPRVLPVMTVSMESLDTAARTECPTAREKKSYSGMPGYLPRDVIDAKIAAEKLQEVATMVDMRFGHGTWKGILAERQKRIQEAREAALKARREAIARQNEIMENVKIAVGIAAITIIAIGFFIFALTASAMAYSLFT